jgi:hypothetical protein
MEVRLRYFEGCPHWRTMYYRLRAALRAEGMSTTEPILEPVDISDEAEGQRFPGSPTLLVDGRDPFDNYLSISSHTCRAYKTPGGLEGSPTAEQLREALRAARPSVPAT